ncbi:LacI family transcriptional regulator [Acrocarpospora pleiomorpha]|uniref:LacI family transcriptional regulator n=1 Tax=Acrocarpospora pleiomorpha TaxID=90975 RepID=A0A5M3XVU8_9ACTN|nr:LacI family DNA-binding transcriptional regulator [Acrocarpospora pleiomorpha]GES25307.1 LacI family transcriptional regulator [Acrocarpospora pleiomorpha]
MDRSPARVTLKDIARLAGVHPATASRALDPARGDMLTPETRDRVRRVAQEAGYHVNSFARSLRKNSSGMVGVVVADVANPFLPPILRGIEQIIRAEQKLLLIAETHDDGGTLLEIIDHFVARRVDAVILSAAHFGDEQAVASLAEKIPVVLAVRSVGSARFPTITHDDVLGGQLAAEHLVSLGHRDLAQLRGPMDVSSFRGREQGFAAVMSTTTARERFVDQSAAAPTVEEGRRLAEAILDAPGRHPTAFFAHNDLMAVGALEALRDRGLTCPRDISIVGYNDAPLSNHVNPPLTTVRLPSLELGRRVATLALAVIAGATTEPTIEKLPPELVIRQSTGAPSHP